MITADAPKQDPLSADDVEQALDAAFSRPEFAQAEPPWLLQKALELYQWFIDALRRLMLEIDILQHSSTVLYWLIVGWLVLAALGLLAHLGWTAVHVWRSRDRRPAAAEPDARPARTAEHWDAEARRAGADGRWRDAAVALYQALLLRLDSAGALRFDPSKTPGDYRRETIDDAPAHSLLREFLGIFEPAVYGSRTIDESTFASLSTTARSAEPGTPTHAANHA